MGYEFGLIMLLILLNGVFAMSEMAIVSARKHRLQQRADDGHAGAARALELVDQPTRFLSTIQVGITSIGVLSGALGEAAIAKPLLPYLAAVPQLQPYADELALAVTVVVITYLSLILGELVPKRLALNFPESIAAWTARPMHWLSLAALPAVKALILSTELVLWLLRIKPSQAPSITEEEIKVLLEQGTEEGVFEQTEQQLMENILRLDDRKVGAILRPRKDIVFLDLGNTFEENRQRIVDHRHWVLPLCENGLENIIGVVKTKDLLNHMLMGEQADLRAIATPALYVPESLTLMELLEQFRASHLHTALVVDEYGEVEGLVSLGDVLGVIVGHLSSYAGEDRPEIVEREDGSWLVDGMLDIDRLKAVVDLDELPEERAGEFNTVGGFVMLHLGRVPRTADHFEFDGLRIEVVDMDGNRVDKVLVSRITDAAAPGAS
ncbi:hemolysin family protein [Methylococcus sp. EFPC2]|uniref:hemolysin family protein n=1 Tax=Methylococcus sp. EFPC2 TaxID=2812648 RepID=UPI001967477D|nr:hemolysin family protein [Methylococcus sp. EFPC2]QSA96742.1 HlyC/CorC family transporter [Methylococcus sp. EFPC2]